VDRSQGLNVTPSATHTLIAFRTRWERYGRGVCRAGFLRSSRRCFRRCEPVRAFFGNEAFVDEGEDFAFTPRDGFDFAEGFHRGAVELAKPAGAEIVVAPDAFFPILRPSPTRKVPEADLLSGKIPNCFEDFPPVLPLALARRLAVLLGSGMIKSNTSSAITRMTISNTWEKPSPRTFRRSRRFRPSRRRRQISLPPRTRSRARWP
jgi:hypothetical protein